MALLGLVSLGTAAPADLSSRQETAVQATDRLLFSSTMSQFLAARNARNPPSLDWSSDGCSSSPDNPFGFDFRNSCYRHVSTPHSVSHKLSPNKHRTLDTATPRSRDALTL